MGTPLFGMDLAGTIYGAFKGKMVPMTLTRYTAGAVDPANLAAGPVLTPVVYTCEGFIDDRTLQGSGVGFQPTDNIVRKERQLSIFSSSFKLNGTAVTLRPLGDGNGETGDKATISGKTYSIIRVKTDPAEVLFICSVRA
jgi:hypothetical protein